MRNMVLGTVVGLLVGMLGALAYSHFLGDGASLGDIQAQLDAANAKLAKIDSDKKQLAQQSTGEADQVDALQASNEELKKQLAAAKSAAPDDQPAAAAPQVSTAQVAGMIMNMMRDGGRRPPEAQLFVLKTRLHLTDDQAKKVREAMDTENKARRDLMRARFQGGQADPATTAAASSVQKTLATILAPDQQMAYAQLQSDEKAARAETTATSTIDQMMPLLQLTDAQKEQAMNALYQQQLSAPDPASLLTDPRAMNQLSSQAQAQSSVLAKVLNQDQLALYTREQQVQSDAFADMQARRQQRAANGNGGNGPGGGPGNGGPPGGNNGAPTATSAMTPAVAAAPAATGTTTASTNAPSAVSSTNSTASTAPPSPDGSAPPPPPPGG